MNAVPDAEFTQFQSVTPEGLELEARARGTLPNVDIMSEQDKYTEMWRHEQYRGVAPGEQIAPEFLNIARPRNGAKIIDFGAGTGRGSRAIAILANVNGLDVDIDMLDFASNALDEDVVELCKQDGTTTLRFTQHDLTKPVPMAAEYGFCFPAGTPVAGSGKTIDELRVGDEVTNSDGVSQKVLKTFKHRYTGEMISLSIDCLPEIEMTDEHPVQVCSVKRVHRRAASGGQKSVYEWVAGMPEWRSAKDVKVGDWVQLRPVAISVVPTIEFLRNGTLRKAEVDEEVAWLLGLYVAEGCVGNSPKGRITLNLGANEVAFAERAIAAFRRLGLPARISKPPSVQAGGVLRVLCDSAGLAEVLQAWSGLDCYTKRIPGAIANAPAHILEAFLSGLVDGDGCLRTDRRNGRRYYSVSTVSQILAADVTLALVKLGRHCAWSKSECRNQSVINGRTVANAPAHCISWSSRTVDATVDKAGREPYGRMKFIGGSAFARVRAVSKRDVVAMPVFNVHTEDETYGVPFVTHNCTDVMEHIPPEQVDLVLTNILQAARHVFFQISCVDDSCGKLIGHSLHLSVHEPAWWKKKLEDLGCTIHYWRDDTESCIGYVTAWSDGQDIVDVGMLNIAEEAIRNNVRTNLKAGWHQVMPHAPQSTEVMILGGGPSLAGQLDAIRRMRFEGKKLVTLNGAYNWAIENGLEVSAQIVVDARPHNARFTKPVQPSTIYLMGSQVDPAVLEGLPKERTLLWHTTAEAIRDILEEECPGRWFGVPGGSTVLLRAIPLLRMLGYSRFHLFGCDSCVRADAHHAYAQPENDGVPLFPATVGGRVFQCTAWQIAQCQEWMNLIRIMGDMFEVQVHGDGLLGWVLHHGAQLDIDLEEAREGSEK